MCVSFCSACVKLRIEDTTTGRGKAKDNMMMGLLRKFIYHGGRDYFFFKLNSVT